MRKPLGILVLLGGFATAVVGAWAWFNVGAPPQQETRWLVVTTNVQGFVFSPESLERTATEMLGTPKYVNGTFRPLADDGDPGLRIFCAEWPLSDKAGLTVLQHTPDVCWVGAGWQLVDAGQPFQVEVSLRDSKALTNSHKAEASSSRFLFECRAFQFPGRLSKELVLWCTLVGGEVLPESSLFRSGKTIAAMGGNENNIERQLAVGRRLTADYFVHVVSRRLRTRGGKQFVRISAPIAGSWQETLEKLTLFAGQLLTVERKG